MSAHSSRKVKTEIWKRQCKSLYSFLSITFLIPPIDADEDVDLTSADNIG